MLLGITSQHRSSINEGAPFPTLLQTGLTSLSYFAHPLIICLRTCRGGPFFEPCSEQFSQEEDYYMHVIISSDLLGETRQNSLCRSVRGIRPESKYIQVWFVMEVVVSGSR